MSLDKWIKSDEKKEAKKKTNEKKKKTVEKNAGSKATSEKKGPKNKTVKSTTNKIIKFNLKCSKKGCNYQKTIVKKELNEKDTICPRCKSIMKAK